MPRGFVAMYEAFWRKVDKTGSCWLWTGTKDRQGYGRIMVERVAKRPFVLAFVWAGGKIPDGCVLDHLCRNPACVRPEHLEPVTRRENTLRGQTVPARHAAQQSCVYGHPFDTANTYRWGGRRRTCRKCNARVQRERRKGNLE